MGFMIDEFSLHSSSNLRSVSLTGPRFDGQLFRRTGHDHPDRQSGATSLLAQFLFAGKRQDFDTSCTMLDSSRPIYGHLSMAEDRSSDASCGKNLYLRQ